MTNKKKRIAKRLGASALAVATLASGLSFGAASANAASSTTAMPGESRVTLDPNDLESGRWGKMFGLAPAFPRENPTAPTKYVFASVAGKNSATNIGPSAVTIEGSAEAAERNAGLISLPEPGKWQRLMVRKDLNAKATCLRFTKEYNEVGRKYYAEGCDIGAGGAEQLFTTTFDGKIVPFGAPDVHIVGVKQIMTPDGLGAGDFVVGKGAPLDLPWDGKPIGDQTKLDGAVSFASSVDARATVSGATEANGRVEVRRGSAVVGSGAADASGNYSISVDAPNRGGDDKLTVALVVDGADKKTIEVTAAYGAGVEITDPTNEQNVSGQYTVRGTAQAGASVTLQMNGGEARPVTVTANGQWSQEVTLPMGERTITATQKSKGANTTTSSVTVNPGETEVELTAAGRFDAEDATKPAVAYGAAPTGSSVVLRNSVGQEIGRTVAAGDAYEIAIDPTKVTSGVNTFSVIIEGAPESKSFTLNYGQPAADVVVTKPAKNGTVAPGVVEFAGTGQAGSKIVVRGSVREVASATVGANGAWSAANPAGMPLSNGKYDLYFDQIGKGGLKSTVRHAFTIGETAPIVSPHTVTSPAAGAVVETLTPEFRGAGHEGATITVRGSSRVVATGTVQNGQWVAKVNADAPLAPGSYNLYVDQSIRGTVVGTIRAEFTVSNEAFRQLTLSAPAQGENVTTVRPTFVGTATPGAEIRVGSSRKTVATATVEDDGTWRATPDFDLARGGSYPGLEVKQTTKSGKTSTVSSTFTVDRNAQ
uniref:Bacterial Ig-like domain-containing protein n=1 Tax=Neobacillus citreus TaxID=2833578 RepID=A0A942Y9X7_9BACI